MSLPWGDLGILRAARNQEAAEAAGARSQSLAGHGAGLSLCPSPYLIV